MNDLTVRQHQILEYIARQNSERGFPPTLREIGAAFDIRSLNGVNDHLRALERKGFLKKTGLQSRALALTEKGHERFNPAEGGRGRDMIEVPLFGRVAAGDPLLALQEERARLSLDPSLLPSSGELFALTIKGESMIGDGIHDGDIVFVRRAQQAEPGQIVVALVEDEATVKRYYPEGDSVRLQPSNPSMEPIIVEGSSGKELRLLGHVVGLFRKLSPKNRLQ